MLKAPFHLVCMVFKLKFKVATQSYRCKVRKVLRYTIIVFREGTHVADTGRKRTLFHCMWANSISHLFIGITSKCPFMND